MNVTQFIKKIVLGGLEYIGLYYSLYPAKIVGNQDPKKLGRLKLAIPQVYGSGVSGWAFPQGLYAGEGTGFFVIPEIGDIVLVSFRMGNSRYPVWSYGYWGTGDLPTEADTNYIDRKVFKTTSGHVLVFDDKDKKIFITDAHSNSVELNDKGISLVLADGKKISLGTLNGAAQAALLGDITHTELNKLKADVDLLYTAIQNGVPIPQDGGVGYQTSMGAILQGKQNADFANIKSDKVTLD